MSSLVYIKSNGFPLAVDVNIIIIVKAKLFHLRLGSTRSGRPLHFPCAKLIPETTYQSTPEGVESLAQNIGERNISVHNMGCIIDHGVVLVLGGLVK